MNVDVLLGGADSYVTLAQVAAASPATIAPGSGFMTSCTSVASVDTVIISWVDPMTKGA